MMARKYLLTVLAILAMLVVLSLQGCLFGGGGGGEESGGAPDEGADPAAGGEMGMGGGEMPMEGTGDEMGMGGEMAAPTAGGDSAAAKQAKHAGDWSSARAQCETILAANANDAEAHRILAWILADTDAAGAIEHFNAYLASGAEGNDADEAQAAIERLQ